MSNLDDLYALEAAQDRPRDPPFIISEPVIVSAEVEVWRLDNSSRCLRWLKPSVGDAFIRFIERQFYVVVTDDPQEAMRHWMRLRRELDR